MLWVSVEYVQIENAGPKKNVSVVSGIVSPLLLSSP